jgi:hypothetical protein
MIMFTYITCPSPHTGQHPAGHADELVGPADNEIKLDIMYTYRDMLA